MTRNRDAMAAFVETLRDGGYGDEFYAPDVVVHDWTQPGEVTKGLRAVTASIIGPSKSAFPDGRIEIQDVLSVDPDLLVRAEWVATFAHDYGHIPATGKATRWHILDQYRFRDGQIVEIWFAGDTLQAARALGAIPDDGDPW